jgi:hypothetical protein
MQEKPDHVQQPRRRKKMSDCDTMSKEQHQNRKKYLVISGLYLQLSTRLSTENEPYNNTKKTSSHKTK